MTMIEKIKIRIEGLKEENKQIASWIVRNVETDTRNDSNCSKLIANENIIRELRLVIEEMEK